MTGLLIAMASLGAAPAADGDDRLSPSRPDDLVVVARVGEQPICRGEVRREAIRVLDGRPIDPEGLSRLHATVLEQLIQRRLAFRFLSRRQLTASEQDVDFETDRIRRRVEKRGMTMNDYLRRLGIEADEFRRRLAWQLTWQQYLQKQFDDGQLKKHFESHRRDFDGTQMRIAHILIRGGDQGDAVVDPSSMARANTIRTQIESGAMTFAEAAQQYSAAPSADEGGDLGFISRHHPMPEAFSREAFSLDVGQTSRPVATRFGVHLIHCLEMKPGKRTWTEMRDALRKDLARRLLKRIADEERRTSKVEYTGAMP